MIVETRVPFSYIKEKVVFDVIVVVILGALIEAGMIYYRPYLPKVPVPIPAFLGTAISLILSFKLSQSYDRWWEARKIWGAIVNDSRTLARQLLSFAGAEEFRPIVERMVRRQIAWCHCLGQSLRGLPWTDGSAKYLDEQEVREVGAHSNKSLSLLQRHADDLSALSAQGALTDYQRISIDETLTRLTDAMGKAERIKSTVFPTSYRLYLHMFIYLFILLLSLALAEIRGYWEVLIVTAIAISFFLLEKTARYLQDPFNNVPTDTPVSAIARTIEINLLQLMGAKDVPEPLKPNDFYLM